MKLSRFARFEFGTFSDIEEESSDPFMRHWIILPNLGRIRLGSDNEEHLARIFIGTGANCYTITRKFYSILLDQGLKYAFYPGPPGGIDIDLVGGQRLGVLGGDYVYDRSKSHGEVFIPNKNF